MTSSAVSSFQKRFALKLSMVIAGLRCSVVYTQIFFATKVKNAIEM